MIRWAIRFGPWASNPRSRGYIDERTISSTRRGSWQLFTSIEPPHATDQWRARVKRGRRSGEIRAVRIEIKEVS